MARASAIMLVVAATVFSLGSAQQKPKTIYYVCTSDPADLDDLGKPKVRVPIDFDTTLDSPAAVEAFGTAQQNAEDYAKEIKKANPTWKVWVSMRHPGPELGALSERFEVGNRGPTTISMGKIKDKKTGKLKDDPGGKSYGSFQFASKRGPGGSTVQGFVNKYFAEDFKALKPGTKEFDDKWVEVVNRDLDDVKTKEHEFIDETHYKPVVEGVRESLGLDVGARSRALQNVIWSTAVQHGPSEDPKGHAIPLLEAALGRWGKDSLAKIDPGDGVVSKPVVSDEAIIDAIYDERERTKKDGNSVYFPGLDLSSRFPRERRDALEALVGEQKVTVHKVIEAPK